MSVANKLLQAAAGNASDPVYVDDLFSTATYTGTDGSVVVSTGLDLADKGGMIWGKSRSGSQNYRIYDSGRGTQYSLIPNAVSAQSDQGTQTFGSSSVTLGAASGIVGSSSYGGPDYVLWSFAKQSKFFDIVTYTGNGTAGRTISHNLGSVPGMMIVKATNDVSEWVVYHRSLGNTKYLHLEQDHQAYTSNARWNDTTPTSTVFTVGTTPTNTNGTNYVAYLFAHNEQEFGEDSDEAITHCGSLTLTSGNVTNVNVGFEPQWLLIKKYSDAQSWMIFDNIRGLASAYDGSSVYSRVLNPNTTAVESNLQAAPLATGFALDANNWGTGDYVYMAIARSHKPASEFSNTDMFKVQYLTAGEGTDTFISTGFPVDSVWYRKGTSSSPLIFGDRLRGGEKSGGDLKSFNVDTAGTNSGAFFLDHHDGATVDHSGGHFNASPSATDEQYARYFFRRAKGFYDVVAYNGTGSDRTQAHNLGVAPELIIIKRLGPSNADWVIYSSTLGAGKYLYGDGGAELSSTTIWSNTAPTASVFSLGNQGGGGTYRINGSGSTYIAYLYATADGISKVGSYTGTGSDVNVDCGFSAGAKFVFVKRTDSSSSDGWFLWDSGRGIVSGNDPYFLINNQSAGQVSNTDYIDPLNAGFTITSSAPADLNTSGGTYLFYAIA